MGSGRSVAMALAGFAAYGLAVRPWLMRWGASADQVLRQLPGDDLTSNSAWQSTRAITIDAPPEVVWTQLMRLGQQQDGRGGQGGRSPNAVIQEPRRAGDSVWLSHLDRRWQTRRYVVALLEPGRAMVLVSPAKAERLTIGDPGGEGSRSLVVEPIGANASRLLIRTRAGENLGLLGWLYAYLVVDPGQFLMERRIMLDIKAQAEESARTTAT